MALLDRIRSQPIATKQQQRRLALIGLRYSKEDQGSGNAIEAQRVRVHAFAERHGIEFVLAGEGGALIHGATSALADKRRIWDQEAPLRASAVGPTRTQWRLR